MATSWIQISPLNCLGYAKNKNARAVSATFKMFMPVPPKTSLATTTAKATAKATIQRGTSTGMMSGINMPDTR